MKNNINFSEVLELLVLDNITPIIAFVNPTPNSSQVFNDSNNITLNITSSDNSNISSSFIDFNGSILAYYNFENVNSSIIEDKSTYSNTLNNSNGDIVENKFSVRGNYLDLNFNSSPELTIINNDSLNNNLTSFTLSAFVNINSSQNLNLIGKYDGEFGFSYASSTGNLVSYFGNSSNSVSTPIIQNSWNLVTMTYNSSNLSLYVNGVLVNSSNISNSSSSTIGEFRIGDDGIFGSAKLKIDEVLIYNRAISRNEILSINNSLSNLSVDYNNLSNQNYTTIASIIDVGGNLNSINRTFEINIPDLNITIISPINGTKYLSNESLNLTLTSDQALLSVYYIINDNESNRINLNSSNSLNWTNLFNYSLGQNNITIRYVSIFDRHFEINISTYIIEAVSKRIVKSIYANNNSEIGIRVYSNSIYNSTGLIQKDLNYTINSTLIPSFNFTSSGNYEGLIYGFNLSSNYTEFNYTKFNQSTFTQNTIFGLD